MKRSIFILGVAVLATLLGVAPARPAIHVVNQTNLTFVPADITVSVGDTVRWVWSAGSHTVTNGTSLADPALGTLFDEPLTSVATTAEYQFTAAGAYPYLCRPHATLGMTGIVRVQAATSVPEARPVPTLGPNVPNPFNPSTRIAFTIPEGFAGRVSLRVYDARGRAVRTLVDGALPAGEHAAVWDGRDETGTVTGSGVYLCRLDADGLQEAARAITLLK